MTKKVKKGMPIEPSAEQKAAAEKIWKLQQDKFRLEELVTEQNALLLPVCNIFADLIGYADPYSLDKLGELVKKHVMQKHQLSFWTRLKDITYNQYRIYYERLHHGHAEFGAITEKMNPLANQLTWIDQQLKPLTEHKPKG